jgi:hypothetical protein
MQILKREVRLLSARKPNPNWLNEVAGSMKDFPEFEEIQKIMRELREAELAEFDKGMQQ